MDAFIIEKTEDTPTVILDVTNNKFVISDRSLPENAIEFYQPIFAWFEDLKTELDASGETQKPIVIDFNLEYYNTATAKQLAKLLMILEKISVKHSITVKWHYDSEDIDMYDSGSRYAKLINVNFEFIEH